MEINDSRPKISSIQTEEAVSSEERFQNTILRQVIKMKSPLLLAYMKDYLVSKKYPLQGLIKDKQLEYVERVFAKDMNFRSELRGLMIGQFTEEEYAQYVAMKNGINKRIINIIKNRILDHIDVISQ